MRHLRPLANLLPPKIASATVALWLFVRLNTLNMQQLDFNIIFQPPKEATSDLVLKSVALIRGFAVSLEYTYMLHKITKPTYLCRAH